MVRVHFQFLCAFDDTVGEGVEILSTHALPPPEEGNLPLRLFAVKRDNTHMIAACFGAHRDFWDECKAHAMAHHLQKGGHAGGAIFYQLALRR